MRYRNFVYVCSTLLIITLYLGRRVGQRAGRGVVIGARDEQDQRDSLPHVFAGRLAQA